MPDREQGGVEGREMRLRLDRRIHAQRKELRSLWVVIDGRSRGWRSYTRALVLDFGKFLDEIGAPRTGGAGGTLTMYGRMQAYRALHSTDSKESENG